MIKALGDDMIKMVQKSEGVNFSLIASALHLLSACAKHSTLFSLSYINILTLNSLCLSPPPQFILLDKVFVSGLGAKIQSVEKVLISTWLVGKDSTPDIKMYALHIVALFTEEGTKLSRSLYP